MRTARNLIVAVMLLALALSVAPPARAQKDEPSFRILPPDKPVSGRTYTEWGIAWWQWALSIPAAQNPMLDPTGEFCALKQSGPVWFLAGTFYDPTAGVAVVNRTCRVPAGKRLFFPVTNTIYVGFPWDPNDTPELAREQAWASANTQGGSVIIDGVEVGDIAPYRLPPGPDATPEQLSQLPIFKIRLPEGNVFGIDAGKYPTNAQDGYYLMLAPLSRGTHTVRILGSAGGQQVFDVTYTLIVDKGRDR